MKKLKFTICCHNQAIEDILHGTGDGPGYTFYNNLRTVLNDMGHESEFIGKPYKVPKKFNGDICFVYHTRVFGNRKDMWCIKDSCLFDHWEFDLQGWAGWSEMANSAQLFKKSQEVDLDQAREFFDKFSKEYIQNNISKQIQPDTNSNLTMDNPYVFFPGQIIQDSVVKHHGKIRPVVHVKEVSKQLNTSGYDLVFKKHPGLNYTPPEALRGRVALTIENSHVTQFSGSIHDAIPNAAGVIVINSGVGFESLLYKKHVFVSGHCDYHWVAHKIYSVGDIKKIPEILKTPVDEDKIIKFVYYMLTEVYVDGANLDSIRKKIEKVIKIYEENK